MAFFLRDMTNTVLAADIRTYAVIPLNEECGLIEWVKNTIGLRHILLKAYDARNINAHVCDMTGYLLYT